MIEKRALLGCRLPLLRANRLLLLLLLLRLRRRRRRLPAR